ncbi:glycosyltransferase family 4 protein [Sporosarcina sp. G11-34]|uniref:glycosyltransferase family 4 protein n=1 Tax=Sporosarcina sp. G11-34 TaxID=2849605 RepID=UPI0022A951F7|nr:glycosyltransferase family 4 protein [Sporosarcina sp. G11-34]MCZ2258634.1 glycosyltransferase family 4 protein [Sporosarcina sp. G11-34]
MKVIHLCTYYIGNKLYEKLFFEISKNEISQAIYIPIRDKELVNRNFLSLHNIEFYYDLILKKYDRYFYKGKVKKQKKRVEMKVSDLQLTNVIHAHTLFSDGGTAYLLKKKYGINYVINVRSTDINTFYKYAIHHRDFSHEVLLNASNIIFISPAYKEKTFSLLPDKVVSQIKNKTHIIPNGIDNKWFTTEIVEVKKDFMKGLHLLFTGSLDKNKNLITVLKLVQKLVREGQDVYLNVAGEGPFKKKLMSYATNMGVYDRVKFHGKVSTEKLIELVDQSDIFILPSYKETFGISYIECMSRGVPVIYTRNEGIDGYFPEGSVGYSTDPNDINEMNININNILDDYERISQECIAASRKFNWKDISRIYINMYKRIGDLKS